MQSSNPYVIFSEFVDIIFICNLLHSPFSMTLYIKRIVLFTLSILLSTLPLWVGAYFEHTYWCVIGESTIQVSLTTGEQLCLDYMAWLSKLLQQTIQDIKSAWDNAASTEWYDYTYRNGVVVTLTEKKASLTDVQQKIILAMQDFEQELFVRVKGIVWYYLLKHTWTIEEKIQQWRTLLTRLTIVGNKEQYIYVRKQLDEREREIIFLDRIQQSSDFATLLPPLKRRIELQERPS